MRRLLRLTRSSPLAHYRVGAPALTGLVAVAAALAVRRLHRLEVTGHSMEPTLRPGDRLVMLKTARVRPGDLVVLPDPREPHRLVVKRLVDTSPHGLTVRGDNPSASTDSRQFGVVSGDTVRGRVVYRYFPDSRRGLIGRLVP